MNYLTDIKPLEDEGKTDKEIVDALNAKTIRRVDDSPYTATQLKAKLGSAEAAGDALAVLRAIANGTPETVPMPEGVPESIRHVVKSELGQLEGPGLILSEQGRNDFLRLVGLGEIADFGIWHVSRWEEVGNEDPATIADLDLIRTDYETTRTAKKLQNDYVSILGDLDLASRQGRTELADQLEAAAETIRNG